MAGAAVAGLLTGSFAVRTYAASVSTVVGSSSTTWLTSIKANTLAKVRTIVKGQGVCNTGDNGCKGKNSCKGKSGCKTAESSCKGKTATPPAEASRDWPFTEGWD
jgi:hypothetical protein